MPTAKGGRWPETPTRTCFIGACQRRPHHRGLCRDHYDRLRQWEKDSGVHIGRKPAKERFLALVEQTDGCWIWKGSTGNGGYGMFWFKGFRSSAIRASYEIFVGPIPDGLVVDHLCRNPPCVNPAHLEPVTQAENLRRSPIAPSTINSLKTECIHGHPYDAENTYIGKEGWRHCRRCRREQQATRRVGLAGKG